MNHNLGMAYNAIAVMSLLLLYRVALDLAVQPV